MSYCRQARRHESVQVRLHGQSEFEASHVVIEGSHTFEVLTDSRLHTTYPCLQNNALGIHKDMSMHCMASDFVS